jgi:hypothetical protein
MPITVCTADNGPTIARNIIAQTNELLHTRTVSPAELFDFCTMYSLGDSKFRRHQDHD